MGSGSSRPNLARRFMRTSAGTFGLVASSSKGSPGASARMVNSTRLIPRRTGIEIRSLRTRYLLMNARESGVGRAPSDRGRVQRLGGPPPPPRQHYALDQYARAQKSESHPL